MYDTSKIKEHLSLEVLLSKTTEYDIYNFYSNKKLEIGTITNSPLRTDNNPSFGIFKSKNNNTLLFKDLSTGISGNCIKFVQLLFNITYSQALKKIWDDIVNKNISYSGYGEHISRWKPTTKTKISIQRKNFTGTDIKYWESYGIDKDTLKKYNVFPIQKFWINDIPSSFTYSKENPIYAYKVFNSFKIYMPFSETKKDKWRSNCTISDIQGIIQIPKEIRIGDKVGDLLVITKSLKDIMVLSAFNIISIAPQSETSTIPKEVVYELKKRFKRIIILYDYDEGGIKGAEALSEKYGFEIIFIPKHYLDVFGVKDISDFRKEFGEKKTEELLKEILW